MAIKIIRDARDRVLKIATVQVAQAVSTGGSSTSGGGWIYIEDMLDVGGTVVSAKTYQDTLNNVLQSATTSDPANRFRIRASYPLIELDGNAIQLPRLGDVFGADLDLTVAASGTITAQVFDADGNAGAQDSIDVTLDAPPQLLTLEFTGGYPGVQTELKAGDTFQVTGTLDKAADAIEIQDFGASDAVQLLTFASSTSFTVTMTIGDRGDVAQLLSVQARPRDAVSGAFGPVLDSGTAGAVDGVNVVNLNDLRPTGVFGAVTYPASQAALKGVEQATVNHTANDFDTISYFDPTGVQISIANPTTFEAAKTVTCLNPGGFNDATLNFFYSMNRAANDATTNINGLVVIADVAATITVTEPATRLRSGGNDGTAVQNHTITIISDQPLLAAPTMDESPGAGTFIGTFTGGPSVWTRTLTVSDAQNPGDGTVNTWQNLNAVNLANTATTVITGDNTYVIGGFVARSLTFAAFATTTTMNVPVTDFSKLQAGIFTATNQPALKQSIGTPPSVTNGYTIDALDVNPTTVTWLDTAAAASNSGGTAQITNVEEVV